MTIYGRPGAYVTEILPPLTPLNALAGASLPALVAKHPRGPVTPALVDSWAAFTRLYGSYADNPGSILPFAVSQFFSNTGSALYVLRVANDDAVAATLDLQDIADDSPGALVVTAANPGDWGNNLSIQITTGGTTGAFTLTVFLKNTTGVNILVENFPALSMDPSNPRYCVPILNAPNAGSKYITVKNLITTYVSGESDLVATSGSVPLSGGNDGTDTDTIDTDVVTTELDTLPDQILAVNLPGVSDVATLTSMINWAELRGDKVIVCDGPAPDPNAVPQTGYADTVVGTYLEMVSSGNPALPDSSYGALYAPWLLVHDPSSSISGATRYLPPGPAVLAQYQVTDLQVGPWQTPAGQRAVLNGVIALEAKFSGDQLATLNLANVNALKSLANVGFVIYGGRTLASGYPDMYLSVRRQLMSIEHDLRDLFGFAIFEPNGPQLWQQITSIGANYLNQQFQMHALGGNTPTQAFSIVCDSTNNPPARAQSGLCTVDVGVALMSPAEFLQLNITLTTGSA